MNPLAHIDPFGTVILPLLCMLMSGGCQVGWAKMVIDTITHTLADRIAGSVLNTAPSLGTGIPR